MAQKIQITGDLKQLSGQLQAYIQSGNLNFLVGSGASKPAIETAGEIEKEINQLTNDGKQAAANLRALSFIEDISDKHAALVGGTGGPDVKTTSEAYIKFVSTLDRVLFERKSQLLPRQANIFTTNYDLFIEEATGAIPSLILNDGFARAANANAEFTFAPERYFDRTYRGGTVYSHRAEVPTINLVKLHGSLSWRMRESKLMYDPTPIPKLSDDDRKDDAKVEEALKKYFLILPNLKKFHATLMDRVYYDQLRIFANAMDRENALLISTGFSFDDEHILDIVRRALRNPTAQLLVFAYKADSAAAYEGKFSAQRNAVVVCPEAGQATDLAKLADLLGSTLSV